MLHIGCLSKNDRFKSALEGAFESGIHFIQEEKTPNQQLYDVLLVDKELLQEAFFHYQQNGSLIMPLETKSILNYQTIINNLKKWFNLGGREGESLPNVININEEIQLLIGQQKLITSLHEHVLTSQEFKILFSLIQNLNKITPTNQLLEHSEITTKKCLYVHINSLREKIEPNPFQPQYLLTVFKQGYILKS